jgi:hypothetical protein
VTAQGPNVFIIKRQTSTIPSKIVVAQSLWSGLPAANDRGSRQWIWMERNMKVAFWIVVSVVALFSLTLIVTEHAEAAASPGPLRKSYCLVLGEGGTDCSFNSLVQCQATASGRNAQCYAALPAKSAFARCGTPRR